MSRQLRVKTHGSSLRLYHLWLPLPIPLTMLRNYVSETSSVQDSDTLREDEQSQDEYIHTLVKKILIFLKLKDKDESGDHN